MKINRDDPWYPAPTLPLVTDDKSIPDVHKLCRHNVYGGCNNCRGVTIRLKLAAMMAQGMLRSESHPRDYPDSHLASDALRKADELIEWANRKEGEKPE